VSSAEPVYPYWWGWYYFVAPVPAQTVASGTSPLTADGTFSVTFKPDADARDKQITYNYVVSVDLTDEGGETRSTLRGVRLGFVNVEADLSLGKAYVREGEAASATIGRHDLTAARARAPEISTSLRCKRRNKPSRQQKFLNWSLKRTFFRPPLAIICGHAGRAYFSAEQEMARWKEGAELAAGALKHDASGQVTCALGTFPPGSIACATILRTKWANATPPFATSWSLAPTARCRSRLSCGLKTAASQSAEPPASSSTVATRMRFVMWISIAMEKSSNAASSPVGTAQSSNDRSKKKTAAASASPCG